MLNKSRHHSIRFTLGAFLALLSTFAQATTLEVFPNQDTWLNGQNASTDHNYGASSSLTTSRDDSILMKFTLPSLPVGAYVRTATLRLCATSNGPTSNTIRVHGIRSANNGWIEGNKNDSAATAGEPTWNRRAAPNTLWAGSAGMQSSGVDFLATEESSRSGNINSGVCYSFDVSNLFRNWLNGTLVNSGLVIRATSASDTEFASREASDATIRPRIILDYSVPIGFWRFEEPSWNSTPNEVRSENTDLHGRAYNGANTFNTTPALTGDPGTCRYGNFDGSNDYVLIPDDDRLDLTNEFTVMAWIRPRTLYTSGGNGSLRSIFSRDTNFEFHVNGERRIYWWWQTNTPNATRYIRTQAQINTNQWQHISIRYRDGEQKIYVNGIATNVWCSTTSTATNQLNASCSYGGTLRTNNEPVQIGWDFLNGRQFDGLIDEVRIFDVALTDGEISTLMNERFPCTASVHHYEIRHDGQALTCQNENVTVRACANAACTSTFPSAVSMTLTPTGWVSGDNKSFSGGSLNTSIWHTTPGTISLGASNLSPVPANPTVCVNTSTGGNSCSVEFAESGFIFDMPDALAAKPETITIKAVKKSDDDVACTPAFPSQTRPVKFSATYATPGSGTQQVRVNNTAITTTPVASPGTPTTINLNFNSEAAATISVSYPDAGVMNLNARYDGTGSGTGTDQNLVLVGTDSWISTPAGFCVEALNLAGSAPLAACTSSSCAAYQKAGEPFPLRVSARAWVVDGEVNNAFCDNPITPNFQHPDFKLSVARAADPDLSSDGGLGIETINISSGGIATINNQTQSEVGRFLISSNSENAYFGKPLINSSSAPIGRFYPDHYNLLITQYETACGSTFSYSGFSASPTKAGQYLPFSVNMQAVNKANGVLANYHGVYAKLNGTVPTLEDQSAGTPAIDGDFSTSAEMLFSQGTHTFTPLDLQYRFNKQRAPYHVAVRTTVLDSDGASGVSAFSTEREYRLGRLRLDNAYGPEQLPLPIPLRAEYFDGSRYRQNSLDSCTTYLGSNASLTDGSMSATQTGIAGPNAAQTMQTGASTSVNPLLLAAPGTGNIGSVNVVYSPPAWLRFDWDNDNNVDATTTGVATFGRYRGSDRVIYWREQRPPIIP